jgi:hypothetical protein
MGATLRGPNSCRQPAAASATSATRIAWACLPVSSLLCGNITTHCSAAIHVIASVTPKADSKHSASGESPR